MPLVSVVIPTYNRAGSLPASIGSVLRQTYDDLEVIVVDDGSSDGTEEYVKGIADSRVRYIKCRENKGPAAARNLGARLAEGKYLAFHDSDDEWTEDKLAKQMELMLGGEGEFSLVYSEFAVYYKEKVRNIVPSRQFPSERKSGDIFSCLLLHPLIGTPTMVVDRQEFLDAGGFNESLKAYEDYEFTLRFSREHKIGFVEEPLVRVNVSLNSVSRRYDERIRVQFFMVREMFGPLKERGLLWVKLSAILQESDKLYCQDVFADELGGLSDLLSGEEERYNMSLLLERISQSKAMDNRRREELYEELSHRKQLMALLYVGARDDRLEWAEAESQLRHAMEGLGQYMEWFDIPEEDRRYYEEILEKGETLKDKAALSVLSVEIFALLENMEKWTGQQYYECNVCRHKVFGIDDLGKCAKLRQRSRCPVCGADERERLTIAFLERILPEGDEKLKLLLAEPSRGVLCYLLGRQDMCYEIAEAADTGSYDLVVYSYLPKGADWDADELHRILQPGGICLIPGDNELKDFRRVQEGFADRLENAGFHVDRLGKEWFGEAFFREHGIDASSVLYVAGRLV